MDNLLDRGTSSYEEKTTTSAATLLVGTNEQVFSTTLGQTFG
jgi:hypothetical protein